MLKGKNTVPLTGADVGLKREWLIGQQLNKLATKPGGEIPGRPVACDKAHFRHAYVIEVAWLHVVHVYTSADTLHMLPCVASIKVLTLYATHSLTMSEVARQRDPLLARGKRVADQISTNLLNTLTAACMKGFWACARTGSAILHSLRSTCTHVCSTHLGVGIRSCTYIAQTSS